MIIRQSSLLWWCLFEGRGTIQPVESQCHLLLRVLFEKKWRKKTWATSTFMQLTTNKTAEKQTGSIPDTHRCISSPSGGRDEWKSALVVNCFLVDDPTIQDSTYPDTNEALLNCFRTMQGHSASCWKKWGLAAPNMCPCGKRQTMSHIVNSCLQSKLEVGCSDCTQLMTLLLNGWRHSNNNNIGAWSN